MSRKEGSDMLPSLTMKEVEAATGINWHTLRRWAHEGTVKPAFRSPNGAGTPNRYSAAQAMCFAALGVLWEVDQLAKSCNIAGVMGREQVKRVMAVADNISDEEAAYRLGLPTPCPEWTEEIVAAKEQRVVRAVPLPLEPD